MSGHVDSLTHWTRRTTAHGLHHRTVGGDCHCVPFPGDARGARMVSSFALPDGSVRFRPEVVYSGRVATIRAEEVRIPRHAREALARHEEVVVLNRERAVYVIRSPEDHSGAGVPVRRGRPLREAMAILAEAAAPDPAFAEDMERVLSDVGSIPDDPWAQS